MRRRWNENGIASEIGNGSGNDAAAATAVAAAAVWSVADRESVSVKANEAVIATTGKRAVIRRIPAPAPKRQAMKLRRLRRQRLLRQRMRSYRSGPLL
jgi:hypothetical protein